MNAEAEILRGRAARLLAMAKRLRKVGNGPYADKLAAKAAEYLEEAAGIEAAEMHRRAPDSHTGA